MKNLILIALGGILYIYLLLALGHALFERNGCLLAIIGVAAIPIGLTVIHTRSSLKAQPIQDDEQ